MEKAALLKQTNANDACFQATFAQSLTFSVLKHLNTAANHRVNTQQRPTELPVAILCIGLYWWPMACHIGISNG
jgi:hypothetical protein